MPEDNKKISLVHTPCKECVFAIYDNKLQTGCAANMLDKFAKSGYEILEVYDNEKEFYVINNKKCIFMRKKAWLDKHNLTNIDNALFKATEENNVKYILILNINQDTTQTHIDKILGYFDKQTPRPVGVLIMTDKRDKLQIRVQELAKYLSNKKINWRIQQFVDEDLTQTQKIKAIIQSAPMNRYYYYINPCEFTGKDIDISTINSKILNGLVFGCMSIGGGLFFSYLSWQYAKRNKDIDIISDTKFHVPYENIK